MIIPSIDIRGGSAVQLVGGVEERLNAGDPRPLAASFGMVGEVAVIDLDAAMGRGHNRELVRELVDLAACRVGGGIRDERTAVEWLDAGAARVIVGTAAVPEVLRHLPTSRVIAALDARDGEVVVDGWTRGTGARVEDRVDELKEYVSGFLLTFVEREGRMGGLPIERVQELVRRAAPAAVTVAGGVRTPADVAQADVVGADAQVGMALYTGAFDLASGFAAPLVSDRADGLWPTVVVDELGSTLGLAYSSLESLRRALTTRRGVYFSRTRQDLWVKGASSGDVQELLGVAVDCDRDALRFTVRQRGRGFCHTGSSTCFGAASGFAALDATVGRRVTGAPAGSYTARLLGDRSLLASKLVEEAVELADAETPEEAAREAADVVYFAVTAARSRGATLAQVVRELDRRARRVTRRPGDAKGTGTTPGKEMR